MFKKIFTDKQLSFYFQTAVLISIANLFFDLIIYHYFPDNQFLKLLSWNLEHLSVFVICLTIISQALFIFMQRHKIFITKYKILAISLEACIAIFFLWLITIEGEFQAKAIIFTSSLSKSDHSYKLICTIIGIFIMLAFDFYRTLENPVIINTQSVPHMLKSTVRVVIRRHLLIFIILLGIIQFRTLQKFAQALLHHSEVSLVFDFSLLEIIMPILWLVAIGYYIYQRQHHDLKIE